MVSDVVQDCDKRKRAREQEGKDGNEKDSPEVSIAFER